MGGPRVGDKPVEIEIGEVRIVPPDTVKVGEDDTLQTIAQRYGVDPKDLMAANHLTDPSQVYAGQVLKMPQESYADPTAADATTDAEAPPSPNAGSVQDLAKTMAQQQMNEVTTRDLTAKALQAGLTAPEAAQLAGTLKSASPSDFNRQASLVRYALGSDNPDRALRTYLDVEPLRAAHPDRVTPDIERSLVMGVGTARTDTPAGKSGIMGEDAARRAAETLTSMPEGEYQQISGVLQRAGAGAGPDGSAQTERALLLKSVSARQEYLSDPYWFDKARSKFGVPMHATDEILDFADVIRGKDRSELVEKSTAQDLNSADGSQALHGRFSNACSPTTAQIAEAEADPLYAWLMHGEPLNSNNATGDIAREEEAILRIHGKNAVPLGQPGDGQGVYLQDALNQTASDMTHRTYADQSVGDSKSARTSAMDEMAGLLRRGIDVPIVVEKNRNVTHAELVTDVRGFKPDREFLIADPGSGKTGWVKESDIANGNTDFFTVNGRLSDIFPGVTSKSYGN